MTELLLPGHATRDPGATPFDRTFFVRHFHSDEPPVCDLYAEGEVPVVELELVNGTDCDVFYFEGFRKDYLVALLFVDPPKCEKFYRSYIRYESILRVNVRYYDPPKRKLGFKPATPPIDDHEPKKLTTKAKKGEPQQPSEG